MVTIAIIIVQQPDRSGLFNGVKWSANLASVKSKYPDGCEKAEADTDEMSYSVVLGGYEAIEGLSALVTFNFAADSLYEISVIVLVDDDVIPYYKAVQQLRRHFCDLYGDFTEEGSIVYWETPKSYVSLWNYKSLISVTYQVNQ